MSGRNPLPWWPAAVLVAALPAPLVASSYLSAEAAQRALFPRAQEFAPVTFAPTAAQLAAIARLAGPQAPHGELRAWAAKRDGAVIGHVFVD